MNDIAARFAQEQLDLVFRNERVKDVYLHPERPHIVVVETERGLRLDVPGEAGKRLKTMIQ